MPTQLKLTPSAAQPTLRCTHFCFICRFLFHGKKDPGGGHQAAPGMALNRGSGWCLADFGSTLPTRTPHFGLGQMSLPWTVGPCSACVRLGCWPCDT